MHGVDYTRGAYTWSNRCVKENVKILPRGMVTLGID